MCGSGAFGRSIRAVEPERKRRMHVEFVFGGRW
jgi:hypothetical protein